MFYKLETEDIYVSNCNDIIGNNDIDIFYQ
jgi:hypothetical protein